MRTFQFWILLLGALLVSGLMVKEVFVGRALNNQQRILRDSQETASAAPQFEQAWQELAKNIYSAAHQDSDHPDVALDEVLKRGQVRISTSPPGSPGAIAPTPAPSTAPKTPATP